MNTERIWDGFDAIGEGIREVAEELEKARGEVPVSRHELADVRMDISKLYGSHGRLEGRVDGLCRSTVIVSALLSASVAAATALLLRLRQ